MNTSARYHLLYYGYSLANYCMLGLELALEGESSSS